MNQNIFELVTDLRDTWIRPEPPEAREETRSVSCGWAGAGTGGFG